MRSWIGNRKTSIDFAALFLSLTFLCSLLFIDPGVNLAFLFYSLLLFLVALVVLGAKNLSKHVMQNPEASVACFLTLAGLVTHYLWFSQSPDSSFAPTLILAMLPLTTLACLATNARLVFRIVFMMLLLSAVYCVVRYIGWGERAHGPMLDPNNYATLLYLVWIPWVHGQLDPDQSNASGLFADSPKYRNPVVAIVSFVFVCTLLATHSRFSWLVIVGALLFWTGLGFRQKQNRKTLAWVAAAALVGALTYSLGGTAELLANIADTVGASDKSVSPRMLLIDSGWQMITEHAGLLGVGVFGFSLLYPQYRSIAEQNTAGLYLHNDYLQMYLELGVFGLLPLAVLVVFMGARCSRLFVENQSWVPGLGFLLAIGIAMLHAALNFVFYMLPIAILLGLLLSLSIGSNEKQTMQTEPGSVFRVIYCGLVGCILFFAVLLGYLLLDVFNYGVFSNQKGMPFVSSIRNDPQKMLEFAQLSQRLNRRRGIPVYAEALLLKSDARSLQQTSSAEEIVDKFRLASAADIWNSELSATYFDVLMEQNLTVQAGAVIKQAHELNPQDVDVSIRLIDFLVAAGEVQAALQVGLTAAKWCALISRRDINNLDKLGVKLVELQRKIASKALQKSINKCRQIRTGYRPRPGPASWLMRFLHSD
ncbi:MAG: O-antigen ligase family protein [Pseudomonadaceae bacterium]|nr:O-antigen ligase family protein [Pseudomonadaceae bacterium]